MKKNLAIIVVAMLMACCLGLAACGGSASSSAASQSASAASAASSASAASAEASAAASTASSAASVEATGEVSPEFKDFVDRYIALCDEVEDVVAKAQEAGSINAVQEEWSAMNDKINAISGEVGVWTDKYADGSLSDADKKYYDDVLLPATYRLLDAAGKMLDLL